MIYVLYGDKLGNGRKLKETTLVSTTELRYTRVGLARSLDFSGLGLSVFFLARTGFQFGLFQSLIVYKIDSYHLQLRDRG